MKMTIVNEVTPSTPEQLAEMMKPGPEGPIYMVNLLKFKEKAEYADGRESDLTGREAYNLYGQAVQGILPKYDARPIFMADVHWLMLGQADEIWDEVAIVMYPKRADLVAMSTSEEWQAAAVHRTAGLAGQLNIETTVPEPVRQMLGLE